MVARLLDAATAAEFTAAIQQLQTDIHDFRHPDAYVCWTVNRDAGWEDGDSVETQGIVETGTGKLSEGGVGGPVAGEGVIHIESPYRFRTLATSAIEPGHLLVINGSRVFRVDDARREHADDILMTVYVTELFNTPLPEEPEEEP